MIVYIINANANKGRNPNASSELNTCLLVLWFFSWCESRINLYHPKTELYVVPLGLRKTQQQHRTFDASDEEVGWL